jgi:hypothetical protein
MFKQEKRRNGQAKTSKTRPGQKRRMGHTKKRRQDQIRPGNNRQKMNKQDQARTGKTKSRLEKTQTRRQRDETT